jgi:multidrug efflux pump subunit AcrB
VADKIRDFMQEAKQSFPPDLEYEVSYDHTLFVRAALTEVVFTLFKALGLVILVVFIFLGNVRATLIPCLVVPVPMVGTFAIFAALGFSINTLSLFGLVLAIGSVMDDAIVVVEAVKAHMAEGLSPLEATEKAMGEVTRPIIGVACALLAVYVPIVFLGGIVGQLYRQFAFTLCFAALLSILVALTLTPAFASRSCAPRRKISEDRWPPSTGGSTAFSTASRPAISRASSSSWAAWWFPWSSWRRCMWAPAASCGPCPAAWCRKTTRGSFSPPSTCRRGPPLSAPTRC